MSVAITTIDSIAEFCEITNLGEVPADISGFVLNAGDEGQDFVFPAGTVLAPGETVRVYSRARDAGPGELHYPGNKPLWNNNGDEGILTGPNGEPASTFNWGTRAKEPDIRVEVDGQETGLVEVGATEVGSPVAVEVVIENPGESDLVLDLPLVVSDGEAFQVVEQPQKVVPPGGETSMWILFQPPAEGSWEDQLPIPSNAAATPLLQLRGTSSAPSRPELILEREGIEVDPHTSNDFGKVKVGGNARVEFEVRNVGEADLVLEEPFSLEGPDADSFRVVRPPSSPVEPWGASDLSIEFVPTGPGPKQATLRIPTNDPLQPTIEITLEGEAQAAARPAPNRLDAVAGQALLATPDGRVYEYRPQGHRAHVFNRLNAITNAVGVAAGGRSLGALVLRDDGSVWNERGPLNGIDDVVAIDVQVISPPRRHGFGGDVELTCLRENGEIWVARGSRRRPRFRRLGDVKAVAIDCGRDHGAAVLEDGRVWVWGTDPSAEGNYADLRDVKAVATSNDTNPGSGEGAPRWTAALQEDGTVWAWGRPRGNWPVQNDPVRIASPPGVTFRSIHGTDREIAAIDSEGGVWLARPSRREGWSGWLKRDLPPAVDYAQQDGTELVLTETGQVWTLSLGGHGRRGYGRLSRPVRLPLRR